MRNRLHASVRCRRGRAVLLLHKKCDSAGKTSRTGFIWVLGAFRTTYITNHEVGTSSTDLIYGALYGDFTGQRMHLSFDSLEQYNPIQFLYWIINPYYEKIFQSMSVDDDVRKIRSYLYSEDFWVFAYDKVQRDIMLGREFGPDVTSAVNCMFRCPLSAESRRLLGRIHGILNGGKNT